MVLRVKGCSKSATGVFKNRLDQDDRSGVGTAELWCGGRKRSR